MKGKGDKVRVYESSRWEVEVEVEVGDGVEVEVEVRR